MHVINLGLCFGANGCSLTLGKQSFQIGVFNTIYNIITYCVSLEIIHFIHQKLISVPHSECFQLHWICVKNISPGCHDYRIFGIHCRKRKVSHDDTRGDLEEISLPMGEREGPMMKRRELFRKGCSRGGSPTRNGTARAWSRASSYLFCSLLSRLAADATTRNHARTAVFSAL